MTVDSDHDIPQEKLLQAQQMLLDILPVSSFPELTCKLGFAWRTLLPDQVFSISCLSEDHRALYLSVNRPDHTCTTHRWETPVLDQWYAYTTLEHWDIVTDSLLQKEMGDPNQANAAISILPFSFQGIAVGGLIVIGKSAVGSEETGKDLSVDTLTTLSAKLIAQCRLLPDDPNAEELSVNQTTIPDQFLLPDVGKLEAMAEFAAGAGHEINNPLATILGRVQLLLRQETDPERRLALETIGGQAYRVRDMIGDAMLFGRPPVPEPQLLNVRNELEQVAKSLDQTRAAAKQTLEIQCADDLELQADQTQFRIVLTELLKNAIQASVEPNVVQFHASLQTDSVLISCIDSGKGFTETERQHLFDPFFSGRQAGRGLGFGLSKSWRILTQHGGEIWCETPDGFTKIHCFWPLNPGSIKQT